MKTDNRVLYFSLNPKSVDSFYSFIEKSGLDCQCSFRVVDKELVYDKDSGKTLRFKHATDLLYFLNKYSEDLGYLYVIIDYPSFFNKHCSYIEYEKTNELESFSVKDAAKTIRRAILQYPEVFFMFDESWNTKNTETGVSDIGDGDTNNTLNYLKFLFYFEEKNFIGNIWTEYHKYTIHNTGNSFDAILRGRTSLFDGSNLRYAIKRYEYDVLKVERYNFSLVQDSRAKNLAICVEEERSQNRFNSYALFTNGYRVLPIFTSKELKCVNENAEKLNPKLIVRDYDLQFPDVDDMETPIDIQEKESYTIHTIDYIRGAKYIKKTDNIWNKHHPKEEQLQDDQLMYLNKWLVPPYNVSHSYWDKLLKVKDLKVFFISKGVGDRICFFPTLIEYEGEQNKVNNESGKGSLYKFIDGIAQQHMRGATKPVSGIYTTFRLFETIRDQYASFRIGSKRQFQKTHGMEKEKKLKVLESMYKQATETAANAAKEAKLMRELYENVNDIEFQEEAEKLEIKSKEATAAAALYVKEKKHIEKTQEWYIDTSRENHEHGVPLDIYDTVRNMLERAQRYYEVGKHIRSAILSSEVIEILNGFHEALVLQAYHILAISENAIAMNTIGGNEKQLSLDASFRISKIADEVGRLMDRQRESHRTFMFNNFDSLLERLMDVEREDRRELKYNILNQIYSDCRSFCKEKEHFDSENRFISAMAHVNEGYKCKDIFLDTIGIARKRASTIRQFIYILCHAEKI